MIPERSIATSSQVSSLLPASTTGLRVTVKVSWSWTATQLPFGLAVSVSIIAPVSPAPGVYMGCRAVALSNTPVPELVHARLLKLLAAGGVVIPHRSMAASSQFSSLLPASTTGLGVTVNVN